jgi:hypothetical protein
MQGKEREKKHSVASRNNVMCTLLKIDDKHTTSLKCLFVWRNMFNTQNISKSGTGQVKRMTNRSGFYFYILLICWKFGQSECDIYIV